MTTREAKHRCSLVAPKISNSRWQEKVWPAIVAVLLSLLTIGICYEYPALLKVDRSFLGPLCDTALGVAAFLGLWLAIFITGTQRETIENFKKSGGTFQFLTDDFRTAFLSCGFLLIVGMATMGLGYSKVGEDSILGLEWAGACSFAFFHCVSCAKRVFDTLWRLVRNDF